MCWLSEGHGIRSNTKFEIENIGMLEEVKISREERLLQNTGSGKRCFWSRNQESL